MGELKENEGGVPELKLEQVSIVRGLGHTYLLDGISFTLDRPGARVGIVGASGAGKTTLLRLLNRLMEPTQGQIFWRGKLLSHYPPPLLRQGIMLVPQEPQLLGMTVEQSLAYPLQLQRFTSIAIQQRLAEWKEPLEIPEEWQSRQALALSVGQRQWISLARALIAQPQMLLLDEPTSALDLGRVERLSQILRQLSATVVIVSHHLSVVQALCDHILWLDQGRLRQDKPIQATDWTAIQTAISEKPTPFSDWGDLT